ncbi:hypothetical protein CP49_20905 [Bradyrhizobium valentinum]|uniref:Uncharacterized protein n=1 Tax=Bradyrhizobium valentinum TaxID=1518501 RepID=A0A0R3LPC4_9BRAD|nr:hypothetical protein CP49_20905 [Bradyrhizobium valentinum]
MRTGAVRTALDIGVMMKSASSENESIKTVAPESQSRVNAILTTAFTMCPLSRWLYPEPERY